MHVAEESDSGVVLMKRLNNVGTTAAAFPSSSSI
jgi:hypothetical protein